ncbi:Uncharacterized protein M6B38_110570 [Iris pallida]|uniref:Uncharacterized protein n=1 Tax=Iris pallida TaxID=29817 RepID=A0AAX6DZK1_IRIPA|nr:Uncharacterized protein M6B38_110570 [Iris pallida]
MFQCFELTLNPNGFFRAFVNGLVGAVAAGGWPLGGNQKADAAKRPPPPPPKEKNDPSVTGLRAKILANKKRKEAMKEEIAKLREKGKPVN